MHPSLLVAKPWFFQYIPMPIPLWFCQLPVTSLLQFGNVSSIFAFYFEKIMLSPPSTWIIVDCRKSGKESIKKEVTCYPATHSRLLFSGIFPSVICVGSHKDKLFYNLLLHFCFKHVTGSPSSRLRSATLREGGGPVL